MIDNELNKMSCLDFLTGKNDSSSCIIIMASIPRYTLWEGKYFNESWNALSIDAFIFACPSS